MVSSLLIFLAVLVWGGMHSLLAATRVKIAAHRQAGSLAGRFYRLGYNLVAGVALLPVLALTALLPNRPLYTIPFPWVVLTGLIQLGTVILVIIGVQQTGAGNFLGLRQLVDPASRPGHLVTNGLYAYVRHPLYAAGLVFIWLTPAMSANLLALNLGFTAYILAGTALEERKLLAEFGPDYSKYRQKTPRFLPFL